MLFFLSFLTLFQVSTEGIKVKLYIWGEVKSPGLYYVEPNADMLELISLAGGPTSDADLSHITLIRGEAGGEKRSINLGKYFSEQKSKEPIFLKSGDIVIIKSNRSLC